MSSHCATILWTRSSPDFGNGHYTREHTWTFDGGLTIAASPSPSVVAAPWSNPANIDPEEAFVASVSSCHMLTFLHLASRAGFVVGSYQDEAVGVMTKNEKHVPWVSTITFHPKIAWSGDKVPTPAECRSLHHSAHEQCFIANSIKTEVVVAGPGSGAE